MNISNKKKLDLRKALYYAYGGDYPISGGLGQSLDDLIVVNESRHSDVIAIVRGVAINVSYLYALYSPEITETALLKHEGKNIDRVEITYHDHNQNERKKYIYLDITKAFSNIRIPRHEVKVEIMPKLELLKNYHRDRYFNSAAFWALYSTETIDADALSIMFTIDLERALNLYNLLDDCGLISPSQRGVLVR